MRNRTIFSAYSVDVVIAARHFDRLCRRFPFLGAFFCNHNFLGRHNNDGRRLGRFTGFSFVRTDHKEIFSRLCRLCRRLRQSIIVNHNGHSRCNLLTGIGLSRNIADVFGSDESRFNGIRFRYPSLIPIITRKFDDCFRFKAIALVAFSIRGILIGINIVIIFHGIIGPFGQTDAVEGYRHCRFALMSRVGILIL